MKLDEAIAEVQQYPNLALRPYVIQVVLTAVASGDLIPLADHKLAVALAYQRAADAVEDYPRVSPDYDEWTRYDEQIEYSQAAILALADADPLAEVQALRAELEAADRMVTAEANASLERLARAEAAEAEVQALKAERDEMVAEVHGHIKMWGDALRRAEAAEAEVEKLRSDLGKAWASRERTADERDEAIHMTMQNAVRAEAAEAHVARLREALEAAIDAWVTHCDSGDAMDGDWVSTARAALQPKAAT